MRIDQDVIVWNGNKRCKYRAIIEVSAIREDGTEVKNSSTLRNVFFEIAHDTIAKMDSVKDGER